ncbi:MAG: ABC transporter substrate-binding protein, partial [Chloroflexota bacterium]
MAGQTGQTGTMVPAARVTRRTQLRVAAVALPTAAATACGATRPGDRQSVAPVPANPTGKVVVWSGPVHGVWEQMQPVFAERYTAITVEAARPERKQGQGTFEAMLAALAAGSGPDVLGVDATPVFMGPFVERKAVLPLDRYYAALPNLRKVFGWARREATLEGKLWGVPTATAFEAIWANKTVMDRAGITETPATWEQFLAQAAKLKAALASNHISGAGGTKSGALEKPPVPMMINFPGNAGTLFNLLRASILGRDGIASILYRDGKWDSAEMILVAQTAVELQKQAIIPPQPIDDHYVGHPNFTLGNAAWWPNGSWAVVGFENTKNTNPDQFDYRFFGLPPKQGRRAPQLVGRIVGGLLINAATKVPDAA